MADANYSNTALPTTLSGSISAGATTITVGATTGFPGAFPYTLALDYGSGTEELVSVTAAAGLNLTVTRGFSGTSAQSHSLGAAVRHVYHAGDASDFRTHQDATTGAHGVTGALVGTTQTQTLTNKTLTSPTINSGTLAGGALSGTFTGTPTLSGAAIFTGGPSFTTAAPSFVGATSSTVALRARATGDGTDRFRFNADGRLEWGNGTDARDTELYRVAAGVLGTANTLRVIGAATSSNVLEGTVSGDATHRYLVEANGGMGWGDGTAAVDVSLGRSGAGVLSLVGSLAVSGDLTVTGVGGDQFAHKVTDTTRTATTVLADADLGFDVVSGRTYIVEALLLIKGDSASDINVGWGGGTGHTGLWGPINFAAGTSTNSGSPELVASAWSANRSFGLHATAATAYGIHVKGCLIATSTTTVTVSWGALVGGGAGTTLAAGSYLKATRIA